MNMRPRYTWTVGPIVTLMFFTVPLFMAIARMPDDVVSFLLLGALSFSSLGVSYLVQRLVQRSMSLHIMSGAVRAFFDEFGDDDIKAEWYAFSNTVQVELSVKALSWNALPILFAALNWVAIVAVVSTQETGLETTLWSIISSFGIVYFSRRMTNNAVQFYTMCGVLYAFLAKHDTEDFELRKTWSAFLADYSYRHSNVPMPVV